MSVDTKNFRTRNEIIPRTLPRIKGNNQYKSKAIVALDGGYSSIKGVSSNKIFMQPSFAKPAPKGLEAIGKVADTDLLLRDNKTGQIWVVGRAAENLLEEKDVLSNTDASIYTRYRYDSDIYKVIMTTGIVLGLSDNDTDEVFLQTGLPAKFKENDEKRLIRALTGHYDVSLKIGNEPWRDFNFNLPEENINVIEQPQGTLCSCIYSNGEIAPIGKEVLKSKGTIILDVGFGTEDLFSIRSGYKNNHQTYQDTGMRAVFEELIKRLQKEYPEAELDLKIYELQSYLESGEISYFDQNDFATREIPFRDELTKINEELCEKSIERLMQDYNNLQGYEYLIVTGGTGESRLRYIRERLSGIKGLNIIPGNINTPDLPCSYSNVMGYYMLRHAQFKDEAKRMGYYDI